MVAECIGFLLVEELPETSVPLHEVKLLHCGNLNFFFRARCTVVPGHTHIRSSAITLIHTTLGMTPLDR